MPTLHSSQIFLCQPGVIGEAHTQCIKTTPYIMTQCLGIYTRSVCIIVDV